MALGLYLNKNLDTFVSMNPSLSFYSTFEHFNSSLRAHSRRGDRVAFLHALLHFSSRIAPSELIFGQRLHSQLDLTWRGKLISIRSIRRKHTIVVSLGLAI